jgi:hypothetical protein
MDIVITFEDDSSIIVNKDNINFYIMNDEENITPLQADGE